MDLSVVDMDTETLAQFIRIYCDAKHKDAQVARGGSATELCPDCAEFLSYSTRRRESCPLDPKPSCKNFHIHCYEPNIRDKIRAVMMYSGMHLIKRGRLDLLLYYFL